MNSRSALEGALIRHLARLERRIIRLQERSRRFSWGRLAIALVGVAAAIPALRVDDLLGWIVIGFFTALFAVTAHFHSRLEQGLRRHRFWLRIKAGHLARMRHDWHGIPLAHAGEPIPDHPFENDLNITGPRSLVHLLDTSISEGGSRRLRSWLLEVSPDIAAVRLRQELVRELTPLDSFRDRLTLAGALVARKQGELWDGDRVVEWLDSNPPVKSMRGYVVVLAVMGLLNVGLAILPALTDFPTIWPYTLLLYAALYLHKRKEFEELFEAAVELEGLLHQLRAILLHIETFDYRRTAGLAELCRPFTGEGKRPSALLRAVSRVATAASFQHNPLARLLLNIVMPWDLHFAERFNQAKEAIRDRMPVWLDRWYELEALSSLANFAALNPRFVMPDILDAAEPVFVVESVGHPLLSDDLRVCNDYTMEGLGQLSIVTGSNMSGKSTFLRTLGVNLSLAFAGGPVCAGRFTTIPFRLFTCINVLDSVNDGISYFYAEVRRLKALLTALQSDKGDPLFFLIDEIFRGTNNRERLTGSRAYVRALAGGRGVGLISTHDLELVHLAEELPGIRNHHFREDVADGRMIFDYRLHEGPSPTTNALEIMKMEGLPVE